MKSIVGQAYKMEAMAWLKKVDNAPDKMAQGLAMVQLNVAIDNLLKHHDELTLVNMMRGLDLSKIKTPEALVLLVRATHRLRWRYVHLAFTKRVYVRLQGIGCDAHRLLRGIYTAGELIER